MRSDPVNTVRIFRTMPPSARWGQNTAYLVLIKIVIGHSDLINVRFGPLCGLKSDISRGPRSANKTLGPMGGGDLQRIQPGILWHQPITCPPRREAHETSLRLWSRMPQLAVGTKY